MGGADSSIHRMQLYAPCKSAGGSDGDCLYVVSDEPGHRASPDDPRVVELADNIEQLRIRAVESGEVEIGDADASDPFAALLDAAMAESTPVARRLLAILEERGWSGWTRLERVPEERIRGDR